MKSSNGNWRGIPIFDGANTQENNFHFRKYIDSVSEIYFFYISTRRVYSTCTPLTCRFNITECPLVKQYLRFVARRIFFHKEANFSEAGVTFDEIPSLSDSPSDHLETFVCGARCAGERGGGGGEKLMGREAKERSKVGMKEKSEVQRPPAAACRMLSLGLEKCRGRTRREEGIWLMNVSPKE